MLSLMTFECPNGVGFGVETRPGCVVAPENATPTSLRTAVLQARREDDVKTGLRRREDVSARNCQRKLTRNPAAGLPGRAAAELVSTVTQNYGRFEDGSVTTRRRGGWVIGTPAVARSPAAPQAVTAPGGLARSGR